MLSNIELYIFSSLFQSMNYSVKKRGSEKMVRSANRLPLARGLRIADIRFHTLPTAKIFLHDLVNGLSRQVAVP